MGWRTLRDQQETYRSGSAFILLLTIGFLATSGAILWKLRDQTWDAASRAADNLMATIAQDIGRNVEIYDLSLQAVIEGLQLPEIGQVNPRVTKGGMNTKLHAIADANDRPLSFFMTAGQVSDYIGAATLLDDLPEAQWLLGDRGDDADWFRDALQAKGIQPCIPGRRSRNEPVKYDKRRYRHRSRIEIMFGRLKDWRRVATRYDRCPTVLSPPSPSPPPLPSGCN